MSLPLFLLHRNFFFSLLCPKKWAVLRSRAEKSYFALFLGAIRTIMEVETSVGSLTAHWIFRSGLQYSISFVSFMATTVKCPALVFFVWVTFKFLSRLLANQHLDILTYIFMTDVLSIRNACLINIWPHFIEFCETQVFSDWWIQLRSKWLLGPTTRRMKEMNIIIKCWGPTLQR